MANVQVILREDVKSLGRAGELVRVRPGYARNFLLPHGLAYEASEGNKKRIADYPNLLNYMRELYQVRGVAATVTPRYYVINYWSIKRINPTGIVPKGTPVDYSQPHDRARLAA